ncbi:MAG: hypothetical protein ACRD2X_22150 [Vicinamibacteraceae bacterium]
MVETVQRQAADPYLLHGRGDGVIVDEEAIGAGALELDQHHRIGARIGSRVRSRAGLRVAVDRHAVDQPWERTRDRNDVDALQWIASQPDPSTRSSAALTV